jgi:hypothetical protein
MIRQERETMGQYMLSGTSIISAAGDSVTIRFPKKKMHFCFNHLHDPDARSRSQKVGSLKDFEVCGIPEKEPPHNRQKNYQLVWHDHLPDVKRKVPA